MSRASAVNNFPLEPVPITSSCTLRVSLFGIARKPCIEIFTLRSSLWGNTTCGPLMLLPIFVYLLAILIKMNEIFVITVIAGCFSGQTNWPCTGVLFKILIGITLQPINCPRTFTLGKYISMTRGDVHVMIILMLLARCYWFCVVNILL